MSCPLGKTCRTNKDGEEKRCLWFVSLKNQETGETMDGCAMLLLVPIFMKVNALEKKLEASNDK